MNKNIYSNKFVLLFALVVIAFNLTFAQSVPFSKDAFPLEKDALKDAIAGQGSAWLIGGESGVGKSRLVSELQARALIQGALVLQGQGIEVPSALQPEEKKPEPLTYKFTRKDTGVTYAVRPKDPNITEEQAQQFLGSLTPAQLNDY